MSSVRSASASQAPRGQVALQLRLRASGLHLALSALILLAAAVVALGLWFPTPFRELAGGPRLFLLIISVDLVCGPLLTLILFNPAKSRRALALDMSLVALVQILALGYGLHALALARPVALVFEVDRFVLVQAAQIEATDLAQAPEGLRRLSWQGPRILGTREPADAQERLRSLDLSLQGQEPSARPGWWQGYEQSLPQVQQRMKPLKTLHARRPPAEQQAIMAAVKPMGQVLETLFYLPMTSEQNKDGWIVLLDAGAGIAGYAPVSGFD